MNGAGVGPAPFHVDSAAYSGFRAGTPGRLGYAAGVGRTLSITTTVPALRAADGEECTSLSAPPMTSIAFVAAAGFSVPVF